MSEDVQTKPDPQPEATAAASAGAPSRIARDRARRNWSRIVIGVSLVCVSRVAPAADDESGRAHGPGAGGEN